jgi:hypothetical protein
MYAVVRDNPFDATKLAQGRKQLDEFQALHARQPGFRGSLVVDLGNGHLLAVNLWETKEHAAAALPAMIPAVQRLIEPMLAAPSKLIGEGPVVQNDLSE